MMIPDVATHPKKGETEEICRQRAQSEGAFTYDEFGEACWKVFGKRVEINPIIHSIKEGFDIVNINFRANRPVPTQAALIGQRTLSLDSSFLESAAGKAGSRHSGY